MSRITHPSSDDRPHPSWPVLRSAACETRAAASYVQCATYCCGRAACGSSTATTSWTVLLYTRFVRAGRASFVRIRASSSRCAHCGTVPRRRHSAGQRARWRPRRAPAVQRAAAATASCRNLSLCRSVDAFRRAGWLPIRVGFRVPGARARAAATRSRSARIRRMHVFTCIRHRAHNSEQSAQIAPTKKKTSVKATTQLGKRPRT